MSEFCINLLDYHTASPPELEKYAELFLRYDPVRWNVGSGGGSFVYVDDAANKWALVLTHAAGLGFSLFFNARLAGAKRSTEFISVGNPALINDFCNIEDGIILPRGSFVGPADAWKAVEDFAAAPAVKSSRLTWVSTSDLNWPEM